MIARKVSFAFLNSLISYILGYVSLFFVARLMGPASLGTIAFALAYLGLFDFFSNFGFGSAHIKRVSEGLDLGKCNGTFFRVKLVLTLVMALVVLGSILIPKILHGGYFVSKEHESVIYIILLSMIIGNISMMIVVTFGARRETAKQNGPLLVGKLIEVICKVAVALTGLGVVFLAFGNLMSAVVVLLCVVMLFRGYPIDGFDMEYFKSYIRFALPVMFIGFLSAIAQHIDKVMIQFFVSTEDVGFYSVAQSFSLVLVFLTTASTTLIFPTISSYHSLGRVERIRQLSSGAERYLSLFFCPAVVMISVFSTSILRILLGKEFTVAAPILIILSLVALVDGLSQPYAQQISATDHIALSARISSLIFIIDLMLNFFFVPKEFFGVRFLGLGMFGAALSTLISMSVGAFIFRYYAYRITRSKPNLRILRHLAAALIMGLALSFISSSFSQVSFYHLLLMGLIGLVIYLCILVVLHEFNGKDVILFRNILNPIQLKNYAKAEIARGYIRDSS